jgi:hypothetical protein
MGKDGHLPAPVDTAERVCQEVGADLSVVRVLRGPGSGFHAYLLVGEPLKSAFLFLPRGGLTVSSVSITCSNPAFPEGETTSVSILLWHRVLVGPTPIARAEKRVHQKACAQRLLS